MGSQPAPLRRGAIPAVLSVLFRAHNQWRGGGPSESSGPSELALESHEAALRALLNVSTVSENQEVWLWRITPHIHDQTVRSNHRSDGYTYTHALLLLLSHTHVVSHRVDHVVFSSCGVV